MKRIHWLLASALVFALPACDDDDSDDTQGSATDGDSSDSSDGSDGSDGSGGSTGGSSDGSGGSSDGSGGSSDGSGGSSDSTSGGSGGLKEIGQPCQVSDECQGDVCLFTDGDDAGLCSQACDDWADCPDFWDCVEVENTAFKACFPGD